MELSQPGPSGTSFKVAPPLLCRLEGGGARRAGRGGRAFFLPRLVVPCTITQSDGGIPQGHSTHSDFRAGRLAASSSLAELLRRFFPRRSCMTGGTATHDAIVWGASQEEQAARKAADDPLLKVRNYSLLPCSET